MGNGRASEVHTVAYTVCPFERMHASEHLVKQSDMLLFYMQLLIYARPHRSRATYQMCCAQVDTLLSPLREDAAPAPRT